MAIASSFTREESGRFLAPHTMEETTFQEYLATKINSEGLEWLHAVAASSARLTVHGVRTEDVPALLAHLHLKEIKSTERARGEKQDRPHKLFNSIRPKMILVENSAGAHEIVVQCSPSHEYVVQTSEVFAASVLKVRRVHYPTLEESLADLYRFDDLHMVCKADDAAVFVMGDVDDVMRAIEKTNGELLAAGWSFFGANNRFGVSEISKLGQEPLFYLLGVKESFWGSFAAQIAERLVKRRAGHIIYIAKGGIVQNQESIFAVAHPTSYWIARESESRSGRYTVTPIAYSPPSGLEDIPLLSFIGERPISGSRHVSVPTVVGQTKERIAALNSETIDIEVSHMADRIGRANQAHGLMCRFTALQFLTDSLNPFHNVSVVEASGLGKSDKKYYKQKDGFIWEALRATTVMCQTSFDERLATQAVWKWYGMETS